MNTTTNDPHRAEIIPDGEYTTIVFKRILRHAPERVWEAITNPEDLKQWLYCTSAKIDGRTGGSMEMVSGPGQFHATGKILTWNPPKVYEHEWNVKAGTEMPKGENAIFRYELEPRGTQTVLTVIYRRLSAQSARGFAPGGHVLLDRLEAQLDGAPLPEWLPRFQELLAQYPACKE